MKLSKYHKDYPECCIMVYKLLYFLRFFARILRLSYPFTWILGYQYTRTSDLVELDITYLCNLKCNSCNRSCSQAPENAGLTLHDVRRFVLDSLSLKKRWKRIRVLGGEPTLHPDFQEIVKELLRYKEKNKGCKIEVVTNGFGATVLEKLHSLPAEVDIDNTFKEGSEQPRFVPFNLAPKDDPLFILSDYKNGCSIIRDCGIGLVPTGYYPCAIAGGIDRILGRKMGRKDLPCDKDEMRDILEVACSYCGRFKKDFVPEKLRKVCTDTPMSKSWEKAYSIWKDRKVN